MKVKNLLLMASMMFLLLTFSCQGNSGENCVLLDNGMVVQSEVGVARVGDVLLKDGKIVSIADSIPSDGCEVIDCVGKVVVAGFIDSHVHIESSMVLPPAFGEAVLPFGTTSVIADPHEVVNVAGGEGLDIFLKEAAAASIDVFTVVPSSVPATPFDTNGAGKFLAKDMERFLNREDIVGLGEVMNFGDVVNRNQEIMDKITLFKGKTIDGHTAGMPEGMLDSYVSAGINNDHECYDEKGMLARYEKGMNIYIREGSAAHNAKALLTVVKNANLNTDKFAFCTDDMHLSTIAAVGHISNIVRIALNMGFSWVDVAKMSSLNPSKFYNLVGRGDIKEGNIADVVVIAEDASKVHYVYKNGKLVAREGELLEAGKANNVLEQYNNTVKFKDLTAADFALPENLKNVALGLVDGQLLTQRLDLIGEEWKNLTRLATIERYGKNGNIAVCAMDGYGIKDGAVATSVSHDSHNVVCAGDNEEDMAIACNRLKEIGGGYVIASKGKIVGVVPLKAFGLMSVENAETTASLISNLEAEAHKLGVNPNIDPFTTLSFIALPVIPKLRLLDTGLYDTETGFVK